MKTLITWLVAAVVMVWLVIHETGMLEDRYGPEKSPGSRVLAAELAAGPAGELLTLQLVDLPKLTWASGRLTANHEVEVAPEVSGRIVKLNLEVGQEVAQGEVLAELDSASSRVAIAQAEAAIEVVHLQVRNAQATTALANSGVAAAQVELKFAGIEADRQDELFAKKATTDLERTGAKARLAAAETSLTVARTNVVLAETLEKAVEGTLEPALQVLAHAQLAFDRTKIYAPMDGVVTARLQEQGGYGTPGSPLVVLRAPGDLRLTAWFSAAHALAVGDEILWRLPSRDVSGKGRIVELGAKVDPLTRTRAVHVSLGGDEEKLVELAPGLFAEAWLESGSEAVLLVPRSAVARRGQVMSVRLQRGDRLVTQHVRTVEIDHEIRDGGTAEVERNLVDWLIVLSGLRVGDVVEVPPSRNSNGGAK